VIIASEKLRFLDVFLEHFKIVDLTHALSPKSPTWNGSCGFCADIKKDYDQMFRVQKLSMHAGVGTHMDAPSHRFEGSRSIDKIPLERLILPLRVIDVSKKCHQDLCISLQDVANHEKHFGKIPKGSLVIGFTGWSKFWNLPDQYRNIDTKKQMHFPSFSSEVASLLLERDVAGLGIDTLSPDCLDQTYPVHKLLLGADKYIIENVSDCSEIPACGAYAIALPLKVSDCTECPIRLISLVPYHI
jgi:kynurenine formamidase